MPPFEQLEEEHRILREFIDFVNRQVGVYSDSLSGFYGNKIRIERQIARITFPESKKVEDGRTVMMMTSVEDPSQPDVIHYRTIRAADFVSENEEAGLNERQICWSIIVFTFSFWDEEIRPRLASVRGVKPNSISIDALGDLRVLRKNIIHNSGVLPASEHSKLKCMQELSNPDQVLSFSHDQMHKVFVLLKNAIARILTEHALHLPGAPDPDDIVGVAIQQKRRR